MAFSGGLTARRLGLVAPVCEDSTRPFVQINSRTIRQLEGCVYLSLIRSASVRCWYDPSNLVEGHL